MEHVGRGAYTVPQAVRLTAVSSGRIHYWLGRSASEHPTANLWRPDYDRIENTKGLSFADLIEIRFIDAFRDHGVSWTVIREAARRAAELFDTTHPLSSRQFKTDGRRIFAEIADELGEPRIIDLVKRQYALREIIAPGLYKGLVFSDDGHDVMRWRPRKAIVLDPGRVFGQPIVDDYGVPTDVLFASWKAEASIERVAAIFEVTVSAVREAIDFEQSLAA